MTDIPDYVLPASSTTQAVHTEPAKNYQWQSLSQDQLDSIRQNLVTSILQIVIQAVAGVFIPGGGQSGATNQLVDWALSLLGIGSPLPAGNLFGFLNPENMPNILTGSGPLNLLINPLFQGLGSIFGGGVWAPDTTNAQATTTANGTIRELQGNAIPVVAGQRIDMSTTVTWSGLTYTGAAPVSMGITTFTNGIELMTQTIASLTSPAASGTTILAGSYVVPDTGIDEVRAQYLVSNLATAGNIAFARPAPNTSTTPSTTVGLPGLFTQSQGIIDNAWDAFDSGIPGNTSNNPLSNLFNGIFGIHRTGSGAVSVNAVQDARLDAFLVTGGSSLTETFNGASSTTLNTTNWNQTYAGAGSGTYGLSGSGSATWNTSGSTSRESRNRYKAAALTTDTQSVAVTLAANFQQVIGDDPEIRLLARMNATETEWVEARITRTSVEIGYVLAGSYTRLGSATSISGNTLGTWQLKAGTLASSREFVLLHNGVTVISQTDSGASSAMDSSHWYTGFTAKAGWGVTIIILPLQVGPPDVESWAASDRPAAS